ncbi:MAG TPA: CBS domain-containing protein [Oligoflexia bacterium]|nr:CBS domain-containing protein [Oligoflexia bacterium]HMP47231.1 CBS domain-containing protein [Oligoflexia bacterium]
MDIEIKKVMTPSPHSISESATLEEARIMMQEYGIRHLPVRNGLRLTGILTERDIDFASRVDRLPLGEIRVKDASTTDPYEVSPETKVSEVARTMGHKGIGCALIVENANVVGIFTGVDACKLLGETLSGRPEQ